MNDPQPSPGAAELDNPEDRNSALFANLVVQQSSMAMMLLGKAAHPETGKVVRDLEAARLFIDELEMLEVKTKGNLNPEEAALLKQSLMSLRMAFVEAVDAPAAGPEGASSSPPPSSPAPGAPEVAKAPAAEEEEEHRKRFTKKY